MNKLTESEKKLQEVAQFIFAVAFTPFLRRVELKELARLQKIEDSEIDKFES